MNPTMKNTFSDIDYAFHGYNIYRAYPKENGRDPGYTHKLFEAVYGDVEYFRQTADCRYLVPLGWDVVPSVTCSTTYSSTRITNTQEGEAASFEAGFGFDIFNGTVKVNASFSANSGYQS